MSITTANEAIEFLKSLKTLHINGDTTKLTEEEIIDLANDIQSLIGEEGM